MNQIMLRLAVAASLFGATIASAAAVTFSLAAGSFAG